MEDEECLPENSGLNVYLRNLGFSDVEVAKKIIPSPNKNRVEVSKSENKRSQMEIIDEDVVDQIRIIVSTQMLFEEDILFIEKLLSHFVVVKRGVMKCMFKDLFGVAVIFLGLCFYWVIGYYALVLVSTFYAYSAASYLKRRYYYKIRLKKLSSIIEDNFLLLKKTIKFIEESRLMESKFASETKSKEFFEGFDYYKTFKNDFLLSINEINNVFIKSTQNLLDKVPLYEYIENPEYYLCNNLKELDDSVNLSRLYEIYLLLQSEFLKRLILSLIPNLKLSPNDKFNEINKILTETCLSLLKIKKTINKKFKFLFFNGIHSPKTTIEFKSSKKNGFSGNPYMEEFHLNIQEVSKNFQNLLLRCRILEENLKSEKTLAHMEDELIEMLSNVNFCQKNISDCLIYLKRSNSLPENCDKVIIQEEEEIEKSNEKFNKVEVGFTNLDPKVEDEIFEMYLSNEKSDKNLSDIDDWELNEILEKKMKKEYCKNVMKELKVRLVEKAKYWKKKERELLRKKGLIEDCENTSTDDENDTVDNERLAKPDDFKSNSEESDGIIKRVKKFDVEELTFENEQCQNPEKIYLPETCKVTTMSENDAEKELENINFENTQSPIGAFKTDFFNDLNAARQKILKSSFVVEEELFCDSDENDTS